MDFNPAPNWLPVASVSLHPANYNTNCCCCYLIVMYTWRGTGADSVFYGCVILFLVCVLDLLMVSIESITTKCQLLGFYFFDT